MLSGRGIGPHPAAGRAASRSRPRPDVVLDCRWLGFWGAGRITELLLRGLSEEPPPGGWLLWGPPEVEAYAWPGAAIRITTRDPRAWRAQRQWYEVPPGHLTVFLHQMRPLRAVPAVTLIHDTIQLRCASSRLDALARTAYLKRAGTVSRHVITHSHYSRASIRRDLGVPHDRISVIAPPLDHAAAKSLAQRRHRSAMEDVALYVGRFAAHKNLDRLRAAFAGTDFCRGGGRLVLVGGSTAEVARISSSLSPAERRFVEVRGKCSDEELQGLMATARFLVQPSLEEGYGLPVVEAMAAGLTVCVSDGGSLPEVTRGLVRPFPARHVDAMTEALDQAAAQADDRAAAEALAARFRAMVPAPRQYASAVRDIIERSGESC